MSESEVDTQVHTVGKREHRAMRALWVGVLGAAAAVSGVIIAARGTPTESPAGAKDPAPAEAESWHESSDLGAGLAVGGLVVMFTGFGRAAVQHSRAERTNRQIAETADIPRID